MAQIQLVITLNMDGATKNVSVQGPIQDKFLCYMMLEGARDAIYEYKAPIIQPAGVADIQHLKGNGNGKAGHS